MTRGRWGPPAGRGRRGCYYCRRDMRPADFPVPTSPARAGEARRSHEVQDALLHSVGQLGDAISVLRDHLAAILQIADRALNLAPALTQFALETHARFAHLALQAVACGRAAALEAAHLRLGLAG